MESKNLWTSLALVALLALAGLFLPRASGGPVVPRAVERIGVLCSSEGGNCVESWNGSDFIAYSDAATTQKWLMDGATGNVTGLGYDFQAGLLDLDADNDTSIQADTDDQIDVEINGADDFQFTANTFTALSGSTIKANTIAETTSANGVAVDSLTVKDGGFTLGSSGVADLNGEADALVIDADADTSLSAPTDDQIDVEISGADDFTFTANTFTALSGSTIKADTIAETTSANGVVVDSVTLKDGGVILTAGSKILPGSGITNTGHLQIAYNTVARTDTSNKAMFVIPANANVVDIWFLVGTASDAGTTAVVDCGTTAGDPDEYVDAVNVKTAGLNRMGDGSDMPVKDTAGAGAPGDVGGSNILVLCKYTESGSASTTGGPFTLAVTYMID